MVERDGASMSVKDLAEKAAACLPEGQGHIVEHLNGAGEDAAASLLAELEAIDWSAFSKTAADPDVAALQPPDVISFEDREQLQVELNARGEELFKQGAVANLMVAGGQGSRLGYDGPKGCFYLETLGKTIFELHSERQKAAIERFGTEIPLLIMTGSHNHKATEDFFKEQDFFGLSAANVHFFQQGSVPSFGEGQSLQLAAHDRLLQNPNGHGGTVEALIDSGLLQQLLDSGIQYINYIQVDNILARLDDTFAVGLAASREADILTKVVEKASPSEKVGCLVNCADVDQIVEYSDVTPEQTEMTDLKGDLVLRWGNTAMHIISAPFLKRFEKELSLPFHVSAPKKAKVFEQGEVREVEVRKYERFIFDLLLETDNSVGLAVKRELEFAPIKNASGTDSPETAIALYQAAG